MEYIKSSFVFQWILMNIVEQLEPRDWITLAGLIFAAFTFLWKLKTDATVARYRETIGFLDKNTPFLFEKWNELVITEKSGAPIEDIAREMLGFLDTAALLIKKTAVDSELIYNQWWKYFVAPMDYLVINEWVQKLQDEDKAVLKHYCDLRDKWKKRVDKEQKLGKKKLRMHSESANQLTPLYPTQPVARFDDGVLVHSPNSLSLVDSPIRAAQHPSEQQASGT